jgi:Asp-tRNA(Asn)/Glu-tRNA(Gln) amidotransferase A subunit family amidase
MSARLDDLARTQAAAAKESYRLGTAGRMAGIPVSIKDTFDIEGHVSTYGSLAFRTNLAVADSGSVRRLRAAGAVFVGKTQTAEFGQSATSENLLGPVAANPWDLACTPGGSSGGAAASVAAGLATIALGADGGGSVRIPAAFTGLVGVKPTYGLCQNEDGFRGMSDFVCPGPLSWRVADARAMIGVLCDANLVRQAVARSLRVAWCPHPEGNPVDPAMIELLVAAVRRMESLGHQVQEVNLPLTGWKDAFGPLVLGEERRERGHLLALPTGQLTDYVVRTLQAASRLAPGTVEEARSRHGSYRAHVASLFEQYDVIVTPTTAVPAFPIGKRPAEIAGTSVDWLWGAFPFTSPFNVAGTPALTLPCGFVEGMPVGLQLVCGSGQDSLLLDIAEDLEEALGLDMPAAFARRGTLQGATA